MCHFELWPLHFHNESQRGFKAGSVSAEPQISSMTHMVLTYIQKSRLPWQQMPNASENRHSTSPSHPNQIKSNHFYCHITTAQVPWWVKFLWACSRQCRKTTDNLPMDRQCKKTTNNLHMDRQCKKTTTNNLHMDRQCKKTTNNLHMDRQCKKTHKQFTYGQTVQKNCTGAFTVLQTVQKKKKTAIYIWTDSAKKQQQFTYGQYIFTDCTEDNVQNTHTYTQYA